MTLKPIVCAVALAGIAASATPALAQEAAAPSPAVVDNSHGQIQQQRAEEAIAAIEAEAGHPLVSVRYDGEFPVISLLDSFDEDADQDYFHRIVDALKAAGYAEVAALGKPVYATPEGPEA
ncbi:hypothetical protein ACUY3K_04690 [Corynebacterium uberis]|uniref:hypothetical protein n=1 Tax=Corynebacterium TaxID=1716 RepID=UPI001D0BDB7B|nr:MULTISPECIES: hypothetical protein [Corynebacterium]MCZ9309608.1 hypothetical protein [Corynebacterium sp. c6VSa_13]UDL73415.1 hypothetical protein LH391_10095 [Corynebacterium uberis]UDL75705.1 hypothetical protein LH393_10830 [Corynebacterium uberis]UDL77918.1 hypothetical protein LH394_10815 [Corynebacterium uberis]UDL80201.1 hypothetical protein LH392_11235 [Corynebacterium uberis]